MRLHLLVAVILLALSNAQIVREESINYLLDYVANSHATFIRNDQIHTPQEAVSHMKAKYEHFD